MSNGNQPNATATIDGPAPDAPVDQQDSVHIFISHKHEDESVARGVKRVLGRYGGDRLKLFISEEILPGDDWYNWIRNCLVESKLLLLLFTDPTATWDWCLYEAGLFTDVSNDNGHRRVICLHPAALDRPKPLKHLQSVPASTEKIAAFLQKLYGSDELTGLPPLSGNFAGDPEEVNRAAQEIAGMIAREPVRTDHFCRFLSIRVDEPEAITEDKVPPDAVVDADERSLSLFDKVEDRWTWGDLEAEARNNTDQRWLDELGEAVHRASRRRVVDPVQNTFRARRGGKTYRPILYRCDTGADHSMTFKVLFVEDVSWQLKDVPNRLNTLLTSIVMGTRFRYEVLNRFANSLPAPGAADAAQMCEQIREAVLNIEAEAESRGTLDQQTLKDVFDTPDDQAEVEGMYANWYGIRESLLADLGNAATDAVGRHLGKLIEINNRFMQMASRRYAEFMAGGNGRP